MRSRTMPSPTAQGGLLVAEGRFEPPTHRLEIGWRNDLGCSERGMRSSLGSRAFKFRTDLTAVLRIGNVAGARRPKCWRRACTDPKSSDFCTRMSREVASSCLQKRANLVGKSTVTNGRFDGPPEGLEPLTLGVLRASDASFLPAISVADCTCRRSFCYQIGNRNVARRVFRLFCSIIGSWQAAHCACSAKVR